MPFDGPRGRATSVLSKAPGNGPSRAPGSAITRRDRDNPQVAGSIPTRPTTWGFAHASIENPVPQRSHSKGSGR